jgi:hypothetical protein
MLESSSEHLGDAIGDFVEKAVQPLDLIGEAMDSIKWTKRPEQKKKERCLEDVIKYRQQLEPLFPHVDWEELQERLSHN